MSKDMEQMELLHTADGKVNRYHHVKNNLVLSFKCELSHGYPETCLGIFITALFIITNIKQLRSKEHNFKRLEITLMSLDCMNV